MTPMRLGRLGQNTTAHVSETPAQQPLGCAGVQVSRVIGRDLGNMEEAMEAQSGVLEKWCVVTRRGDGELEALPAGMCDTADEARTYGRRVRNWFRQTLDVLVVRVVIDTGTGEVITDGVEGAGLLVEG